MPPLSVPNRDRAHGLWSTTAPPAPQTGVLNGGVDGDVAVVGAGFTGLSTALHLSQRAARVVVLEAAAIGHGAAGRNSGLINAGMWVPPDDLVAVLGVEYGERLIDVLGRAPRFVSDLIEKHKIRCELERSGTLQCAVGKSGLRTIQARVEQLLRRGADVQLIDADTTARMVGSAFYRGALLDRRTATVQPLAYVRGLAKAAIGAGAQVYTQSPVVSIERSGSGWRLRTPLGTVHAQWVVVATDAYTRGPWPELASELIHLPYFNIATRPLTQRVRASILPERHGLTDTRTVVSSIRLDKAGRLIIGSVGALCGIGAKVHTAWASRAIRRIFPQIDKIALEYAWYGSIGMTDTHLPKFHRLAPRVLSISGYNGRGIAAGTIFGHFLAQHIMGDLREEHLPLPLTEPKTAILRNVQSLWYELGARAAHFLDGR